MNDHDEQPEPTQEEMEQLSKLAIISLAAGFADAEGVCEQDTVSVINAVDMAFRMALRHPEWVAASVAEADELRRRMQIEVPSWANETLDEIVALNWFGAHDGAQQS